MVMQTKSNASCRFRCWLFLGAMVMLLAGCASSGPSARIWLNAPDWSRGILLGKSAVVDPVPMVVDEAGTVYVLILEDGGETSTPRVLALDRQATILWETRFEDVVLTRPDQPGLIWRDGRLQLFWVNGQVLFSAETDANGAILTAPHALSAEYVVDKYETVLAPDGSVDLWFGGTRQKPGLYALRLTDSAESQPQLIDPRGQRPSLRYDEAGTLHALWLDYPAGFEQTHFLYAAYPNGEIVPGSATSFYEPGLSPSMVLEGPWMGIDDEMATVFWSRVIRTGPEAGSMSTGILTFPLGVASGENEALFAGLASADLPYEPYPDGIFQVGRRVDQTTAGLPFSGDVLDVAPVKTALPELAIVYTLPVQHQFGKVARQIATTFFVHGESNGYQLLSYSLPASESPAVTHDADLNLYVTWVERVDGGGFAVYFASSAPDMQANLNRMTASDMGTLVTEIIFGLLAGIALAPFVIFLWGAAGMLVFGLTTIMRRNENRVGTAISLGLSILAYSFVKLATLPGAREYVPFSAWVPTIPTWMQAPLQFVVPISITLFAIWAAWFAIYRKGSKSPLYYFFVFAAVDGFLTMSVYGFLIYNTIG